MCCTLAVFRSSFCVSYSYLFCSIFYFQCLRFMIDGSSNWVLQLVTKLSYNKVSISLLLDVFPSLGEFGGHQLAIFFIMASPSVVHSFLDQAICTNHQRINVRLTFGNKNYVYVKSLWVALLYIRLHLNEKGLDDNHSSGYLIMRPFQHGIDFRREVGKDLDSIVYVTSRRRISTTPFSNAVLRHIFGKS